MLHSHSHHDQTRLLLAEIVLWWVHVDILWGEDAVFQMSLPQLRQCPRLFLHRFLHNLVHSKVDTELVMVLVALAGVDVVDADVVDADEVDADVADEDEADADVAGADEADADEAGADEADAVWAQRVA